MDLAHRRQWLLIVALAGAASSSVVALAQDQPPKVTVTWDKVTRVSKTTPTLQVVVNPPLRRSGSRSAFWPRGESSLRRSRRARFESGDSGSSSASPPRA